MKDLTKSLATTAGVTVAAHPSNRIKQVALGTAQVALSAVFGLAGFLKLAAPTDELARMMDLPGSLVLFIGFAELAAALALEPMLSRIRPRLTAYAAMGLTAVMALAASYHLGRGEIAMIPTNMALGALAAFVAWGRAGESADTTDHA